MPEWVIDASLVTNWLVELDQDSYEQVIAALAYGAEEAVVTAPDLDAVLAARPVNRERVEAHKRGMLDEVRAYRLRELREASSLTQVELAHILNVSQNRISRLERGDLEKSQVDTLRRYVEAIGGSLRIEVELGEERIPIG